MPYESLNRTRILAALRRLGELAVAAGTVIELSLYGGAVFTLVYESRDATKDVDAIAQPSELAHRLALQVAREQGLAEDWLNSHVGQFLAAVEAKRRLTDLDLGPGLRVSVPTASYLLALKLAANRPPLPGYAGDEADLRFLLRKMAIQSVGEAERHFQQFFPHEVLPERTRQTVAALLR